MIAVSKSLKNAAFAIVGGAYLSIFSSLHINPFLKSYLLLVPLQIVALGYGLYLVRNKKKSGSSRNFNI